jgi:prefoldin subunit 5
MENEKLEGLLKHMLADIQQLSDEADILRKQAQQMDRRVIEFQHAIARIAHHSRVNPFNGPRRRLVRRRTRSRRR